MKYDEEYTAEHRRLWGIDGVCSVRAIGSALYLDDAKDLDVLVLVKDAAEFQALQEQAGFVACGAYGEGTWSAMRNGLINLLITQSNEWFRKCTVASDVCEVLKLKSKRDRVLVFRLVRDDMALFEAKAAAAAYEESNQVGAA
jgi:hypothetical protein